MRYIRIISYGRGTLPQLIEILNDYLITCESRYMLGHPPCNGFFASFLLVHFVIFVLFYQFEHDLSPFRVKLGSKTFLDFLFHCFLRKQFTVAPV